MSYRLSERRRDAAFVLSDQAERSYGNVKVSPPEGTVYEASTPLAFAVGALAVAAVAKAGNVGNGTLAGLTVDQAARPGVYQAICIEKAANAGTFEVQDPEGVPVGIVQVGVAYDGPVNFALVDGSVDFVAGDTFLVTVGAGAKGPLAVPAGAGLLDGTQEFAGFLVGEVEAGVPGEFQLGTLLKREAEVADARIAFPAGADVAQGAAIKAAIAAAAQARGIIFRNR